YTGGTPRHQVEPNEHRHRRVAKWIPHLRRHRRHSDSDFVSNASSFLPMEPQGTSTVHHGRNDVTFFCRLCLTNIGLSQAGLWGSSHAATFNPRRRFVISFRAPRVLRGRKPLIECVGTGPAASARSGSRKL